MSLYSTNLESMEEELNQPGFLTEYFTGIEKGDFYEEPVQGNIQIGGFLTLSQAPPPDSSRTYSINSSNLFPAPPITSISVNSCFLGI